MTSLHVSAGESRITFNPAQCGGGPCIRGMRIRVGDFLEMLADGVSLEAILTEGCSAAPRFAAKRVDIPRLAFGAMVNLNMVKAARMAFISCQKTIEIA
jgi:Protein of unknown function (DUF433)